jgi:Predicted aminopeptidases
MTFKNLINESDLKYKILFMSDSLQEGRATGSAGSEVVKEMIITNFKVNKLKPLKSLYYTQSFYIKSIIGRNIIGYIPASRPTDKCLVIGAHYDNIGKIDNKIYPGADANASGTAALLCLSKIFGLLQVHERPLINIIFVAFDAKELSLAGSTYFANNLPVESEDIVCAINIDQIGSTLAPPNKDPNYLLVLGKDYLPSKFSDLISMSNLGLNEPLDIDYTFYGSKAFLNTFYKLSDHYPLHKKIFLQ